MEEFLGGLACPFSQHSLTFLSMLLMFVVLILVVIMYSYDPNTPKLWKNKKEGLQYLGASTNVVRDDTGFPNADSLAEKARKDNYTERLVEAGRYPNQYVPSFTENDLATTLALQNPAVPKTTTQVTTTTTGFRDKMSNAAGKHEEELRDLIGK